MKDLPMRLALLAAAAAGCGGSDPAPPPILLGILTPMTGDLAVYGASVHAGTILAVDEINQAGGIDGRLLQLEARDDGTTSDGSRVAYSSLLTFDVAAVIGPGHSAGVDAMAEHIRGGQTLTISGSTTAASLTTVDDGGYFFRTVPSDDQQGVVLASVIRDAGVTALCIVHRDDPYGRGLAATVTGAFGADKVTAARYDPEAGSLEGTLLPCEPLVGAPGRGILFVTFEGDGKVLMNDAIRRGWSERTGAQIFLVDGNRAERLYLDLDDPDAFDGAQGTSPAGPAAGTPEGRRLTAFRGRFATRWGRQPGVHADSNYDAAYLAAAALAIAGPDAEGPLVREAMAATRVGTKAAAGDWAAIAAAIAADGSVDYEGASGAVDIDGATGDLDPPYYIAVWTLADGLIVDQRVEVIQP
jgi:branched-chain amino acid transport system substrate-binding protein